MPLARPCLDCNQLTANGGRCRHCVAKRKRTRNQDIPIAKAIVAQWIEHHGYVCPGYEREPHPSTDLTADHPTPLARGGSNEGPRSVLCRGCNARKSDR